MPVTDYIQHTDPQGLVGVQKPVYKKFIRLRSSFAKYNGRKRMTKGTNKQQDCHERSKHMFYVCHHHHHHLIKD
jgi:hypothetical protein